jgi:LAO/AO transport system kinase
MTMALSPLARGIVSGDRRALARGITLVESNRAEDAPLALALLRDLLPSAPRGLRVGISGAPGVGKSSLIEKLGMHLLSIGRKPAVLVIDPSSQRGGGSILGDKTRMLELGRSLSAYVRPSPSGELSGGIARNTGDVLLLCEAAGYAPALIETVGVGQAESAVVSVVDLLLLLLEPGAGDELQGLKRGLSEWGDVIAVNKADGARLELARRTSAEFGMALGARRHGSGAPPEVHVVSALENVGIEALWAGIEARFAALDASGELEVRRSSQRRAEFQRRLQQELWRSFLESPICNSTMLELERRVSTGELLAGDAVSELLGAFYGTTPPGSASKRT